MALNNTENKLKETLENRRMQPSVQAWDTLQGRLDTPQKKQVKTYWVYAIAASLVGVLLVSTVFFKSNVPDANAVDSKPIEVTDIEEPASSSVTEITAQDAEITLTKAPKTEPKHNQSKSQQPYKKKASELTTVPKTETNTQIAEVENSPIEKEEPRGVARDSELRVVQDNTAVTDAYLEDLLQKAEQDIQTQKSIQNTIETVNSEQLLEHVENEIEHSFREQVFDAVKSGFIKVKTAVVERNN